MIAFDAIMYQSERYILVYQEYFGQKYVSCSKTDDSTFLGYGFVDDSVKNIFFIKGVSYTETSSAVQLGDFVFPIQPVFLETQTCAGNWCFYLENYFPVQTLDYLTHPKQIGLDEGPAYATYEVEAVAAPRASGNFATALDVPNLGPADFVKTNYFLTLKQSENSVHFGSKEQRLFLHRLQYAGCGVENASYDFDLGLVRYENGKIFSVDGRDDYLQSKMHVYDSLGQYIAAYPVTDPHDACLVDSFTVGFDYIDSGVFYINPPIVINNNTGVRYKIPSDELYPLFADSCVLASGQILFPDLGDIDHGNSVYMFWVETLQRYVVLRSGRNLGLYPNSYPLCAWQFEPVTGTFILDHQLIDLFNSSPFGFGRDGGHDFQVEMEFSDNVSETFLLSQYDNVVCDDPTVGSSYGHTAYLKYVAGIGWDIFDFKRFTAPPSTAMGNIDVFKSHTSDTCVVISAAGGVSGSNVSIDPQVVVYDYSSREKMAHLNFLVPNFRVVAYQCNATSEKFQVPSFKLSTHEDLDSLYVVADSIPQGTWFWWLGNKSVTQSLSIAKSAIGNDGGIAIYASGWYSEADTVPGATSCERSRWISEPTWVPVGATSFIDVDANKEIRIYPNPTLDQVVITGAEKNSIVTVSSLTGQELFKTAEKRVSLQQYPAGVYFFNVTNRKVVKIIKL